jgi:hypothetical protein
MDVHEIRLLQNTVTVTDPDWLKLPVTAECAYTTI